MPLPFIYRKKYLRVYECPNCKDERAYTDRIVVTENNLLLSGVYELYGHERSLDSTEKEYRDKLVFYSGLINVTDFDTNIGLVFGDLIVETSGDRYILTDLPKNIVKQAADELKLFIDQYHKESKANMQRILKDALDALPPGAYSLYQLANFFKFDDVNLLDDNLREIMLEIKVDTPSKGFYDMMNQTWYSMEDIQSKTTRLKNAKVKIKDTFENLSIGSSVTITELIVNVLKYEVTLEECTQIILDLKNEGNLPEGNYDQVKQIFTKKEEIGFSKSLEGIADESITDEIKKLGSIFGGKIPLYELASKLYLKVDTVHSMVQDLILSGKINGYIDSKETYIREDDILVLRDFQTNTRTEK